MFKIWLFIKNLLKKNPDNLAFIMWGGIFTTIHIHLVILIFWFFFIYFIMRFLALLIFNFFSKKSVRLIPEPFIIDNNSSLFLKSIWAFYYYTPYSYGFLMATYIFYSRRHFSKMFTLLFYNIMWWTITGVPRFWLNLFREWLAICNSVHIENKNLKGVLSEYLVVKLNDLCEIYKDFL